MQGVIFQIFSYFSKVLELNLYIFNIPKINFEKEKKNTKNIQQYRRLRPSLITTYTIRVLKTYNGTKNSQG